MTSETLMRGRFSGGLTVGVIPMSTVERVRIEPVAPGYLEGLAVSHLTANKSVLPHDHRPRPTPVPRLWARLNGMAPGRRRRRAPAAAVDGAGVREALGLPAGAAEPLVVVVATNQCRGAVLRWIAQARRAGCETYRIVCADRALGRFLDDELDEPRTVALGELVAGAPDVEELEIELAQVRREVLAPLRTALFRRLAAAGCDFIHCEPEMVWAHDPRPWLAQHRACNLLLAHGETGPAPHDHHLGFHFAVSGAFFLCRADDRMRRLFAEVAAHVDDFPDLDYALNLALAERRGTRWRVDRPMLFVRRAGTAWVRAPLGRWRARCAAWLLRTTPFRLLARLALAGRGAQCVVAGAGPMRGRYRDGTQVGVVPMDLVHAAPAIPVSCARRPAVSRTLDEPAPQAVRR